jgi:hypothetical protein
MRKQFCAYTKGMKGGAAIREQAVHAETIADYRKVVGCIEVDDIDHNLYC